MEYKLNNNISLNHYDGKKITINEKEQQEIISYIFEQDASIDKIYNSHSIPHIFSVYKMSKEYEIKENQFGKKVMIVEKNYQKQPFGSFVKNLNHLLHLQSLINNELIDGVILNVKGKIDSHILDWLNGKLIGDKAYGENITFNYELSLPSGKNYVFTLKPSVNPISNIIPKQHTVYNEEDLEIITGFQSLLKYEPQQLIRLLSSNKNEKEFYENIWKSCIVFQKEEEFLDKKEEIKEEKKYFNIYLKEPYLEENQAKEYIASRIQLLQKSILSSEEMTKIKKNYILDLNKNSNAIDFITNKIYQHIIKIQQKTYHFLEEGEPITLDIDHIVLDMIQDYNKTTNKKGRSYDNPERFLNTEQLKKEIVDFEKEVLNNTQYNLSIEEMGKITVFNKISKQKTMLLISKLFKENIDIIFKEFPLFLKERLKKEERKIFLKLSEELDDMNQKQQENGKKIEQISKEKGDEKIRKKFFEEKEILIQKKYEILKNMHNILLTYFSQNQTLINQWNHLAKKIVECSKETSKKYIYVVNQEGNLIFSPEKLDNDVQGRAAHSELAQGEHIYAAGEIKLDLGTDGKMKIVEINNGSGHYRPNPKTILLAYKIFQKNEFDIQDAELINSLGRFSKLKEAEVIPTNKEKNNKSLINKDDVLLNMNKILYELRQYPNKKAKTSLTSFQS